MKNLEKYNTDETVKQIYKWYKNNNQSDHRPHLGGSQIGMKCKRALWYQFHWCKKPNIDGRVLRLFDHGNWEELRLIKDLRRIGVKLYDVDPKTGSQFYFSDLGGHLAISIDSAAKNFPNNKKWHLLEFKTANDKSFNKTKKDGVYKDKPQHYAQMQLGMYLGNLDRAYYFVVNKNTDEIYAERIHFNKQYCLDLIEKAKTVIFDDDAPPGISNDPSWYECKMCDYRQLCHFNEIAEMNCRTCLHSTATEDGQWHCNYHDTYLSTEEQRKGCENHLYRPHLVPNSEAVNADMQSNSVMYKLKENEITWYNSKEHATNCFKSVDIQNKNSPFEK